MQSSLHAVNEHFEFIFNAVSPSAVVLRWLLEQSVADLITLLQQLQADIPFPLQDRFELWLFDNKREQPVALIASCQAQEEIDISKRLEWYPATRADTTFTTSAFSAAQQRATIKLSAQNLLHNAVRQRCNRPYAGYWTARQADAAGGRDIPR